MKYKILVIVAIAAVIYWQKSGLHLKTETADAPNVTVSASMAKKEPAAATGAKYEHITATPEDLNDRRYKSNSYIANLLLDESVKRSLAKTQQLFKDTPNGEDIAIWVCLGKVLDSSPGYGEVLNYAFSRCRTWRL